MSSKLYKKYPSKNTNNLNIICQKFPLKKYLLIIRMRYIAEPLLQLRFQFLFEFRQAQRIFETVSSNLLIVYFSKQCSSTVIILTLTCCRSYKYFKSKFLYLPLLMTQDTCLHFAWSRSR